jgi:serine/threonine protein kinase
MIECPRCDAQNPDSAAYCQQCSLGLDQPGVDSDPLVGKIFHRKFRILSRIGTGGFGTVYRARDEDLDHVVALKVVHRHVVAHPKQIKRFRQEGRVLRLLGDSTRHVPTLYGYGHDDETKLWYLCLELLDGSTLRQIIVKDGVFDEERAVDVIRQVCAALGTGHGLEPPVVHRDLKPDNVMVLRRDGRDHVKILDFGIAKVVGHDSLTDVGQGLGSYGYMAPEQVRGEDIDARTDLFALGVTFYNILTGRDPWLGRKVGTPLSQSDQLKILDRSRHNDPIPPQNTDVDVSADLAAALLKLLHKDPNERFQTADELDRVLEQMQLSAGVPYGGRLAVKSLPTGAEVVLKRGAATQAKGRTPWEVGPLPPGTYQIKLRAKNCEPVTAEVRIIEDAVSEIEIPLQRRASSGERLGASLSRLLGSASSSGRKAASRVAAGGGRAVGEAGTGLASAGKTVASALPWGKISLATFLLLITGSVVYLLAFGPLRKPAQDLVDRVVDLFTPPEEISSGVFLASLASGEVLEVTVREGGGLEALVSEGEASEQKRIVLAGMGFQELMRAVRQYDAQLTSRGDAHLRINALRESGDGAPDARISVRSAVGGCAPCAFDRAEELPPDWYVVSNDTEEWLVRSALVTSSPGGGQESLSLPDTVFLAGGTTTEIELKLASVTGINLNSLLQGALLHLRGGRRDSAIAYLGQIEQIDESGPEAGTLRTEIADDYVAEAKPALERQLWPQAVTAAESCLGFAAGRAECSAIRDSAVSAQRREDQELLAQRRPLPRNDESPREQGAPPAVPTPSEEAPPIEEPDAPESAVAALQGTWVFVDRLQEREVECTLTVNTIELIADGEQLTGQNSGEDLCGIDERSLVLQLRGRINPDNGRLEFRGERGDDTCSYIGTRSSAREWGGEVACDTGRRGTWRIRRS